MSSHTNSSSQPRRVPNGTHHPRPSIQPHASSSSSSSGAHQPYHQSSQHVPIQITPPQQMRVQPAPGTRPGVTNMMRLNQAIQGARIAQSEYGWETPLTRGSDGINYYTAIFVLRGRRCAYSRQMHRSMKDAKEDAAGPAIQVVRNG